MEELLEILRDMHPDVDFETEEHLVDDLGLPGYREPHLRDQREL